MTDPTQPLDDQRVWCRRLDCELPVRQHADCLYCFGSKQQIACRAHEQFCDFKKGQDPIHFGFPPDTSRNLES